jgi:hypothetical protein
VTLRVRIDGAARAILLRGPHAAPPRPLLLEPARPGAWREASVSLDGIEAGDRLTLEADGAEYRDYHVWLERDLALAN